MAIILLMTFSRQRAPDDLKARLLEVSTNAPELIERNEAHATATEFDVLKLTLEQLDAYERSCDAQVHTRDHLLSILAKARLGMLAVLN